MESIDSSHEQVDIHSFVEAIQNYKLKINFSPLVLNPTTVKYIYQHIKLVTVVYSWVITLNNHILH